MSRDQEVDFLQNQAQAIKEDLEDIEARLSEIQQKES
jgi:prefoldin subunit 5